MAPNMPQVCSAFQRCSVLSQVELNRTKCVCSCGSRARDDVCMKAAPTSCREPVLSSMPPLRSVWRRTVPVPGARCQASLWASMMRWSIIVTARIETLLGGEHRSRNKSGVPGCCGVNCSPVSGCWLSHNFRNVSRLTTSRGCKPNRSHRRQSNDHIPFQPGCNNRYGKGAHRNTSPHPPDSSVVCR